MNTPRESNIYTGKEAREALMRGVDAAVDAVKVTLGAAGSNVILEANVQPGHRILNDGVAIVQMVQMAHPVEQIGANLIKEIASRSDKESGDGTTTSSVLAQAILKEGMKYEGNAMELKRSLNECLPIVNASLEAQKRDISVDEVGIVATISSESEELGAMLQEVYQTIGKDGIVELDTSNLPESFYEITDGVRLRNTGFLGAYSTTEPGKAVYKNPLILITRQKISTIEDIEPVVKMLAQRGKSELVIYAEEIDMGVASMLAATHLQGKFKTLLIKAPTLWKDLITEDFAKITGATIIDTKEGYNLRTVTMSQLGTCETIITTKDETRVIGIKDISEWLSFLEAEGSDESKMRLVWLQTKAAVIKLGASTETELSYLIPKAEDARNASYLALQGGVVIGGGVALLNVSKDMPDTIGGRILREALKAPARQIGSNAGYVLEVDSPDYEDGRGFNSKTGEFTDMFEAGIVDPLRVVRNSIKNAVSVAGTVLTAPAVITFPKIPQDENTHNVPSA